MGAGLIATTSVGSSGDESFYVRCLEFTFNFFICSFTIPSAFSLVSYVHLKHALSSCVGISI